MNKIRKGDLVAYTLWGDTFTFRVFRITKHLIFAADYVIYKSSGKCTDQKKMGRSIFRKATECDIKNSKRRRSFEG